MSSVIIRPLCEADWEGLRAIRLQALRTERPFFHSCLEDELEKSESEWRALAGNGDDRQCVFGLFDGETLIGITGAFTDRDDGAGRTARLGMTYIQPAYRGRGLTQLLYGARLAWIRARPHFTTACVSHRRANEPSGRAIRRHGFALAAITSRTWHDGAVDDELHYVLKLEQS